LTCTIGRADDDRWTDEQLKFFEAKIRPVLIEKCYGCHSDQAKSIAGNFRLDFRALMLQGGDSGPAVEPGNPDDSLLMQALRYDDPDLAMPPKKDGGKLPDDVIADFQRWIEMGVPDPRKAEEVVQEFGADDDALQWWAFQPRQSVVAPQPMDADWPQTDIDRFVLAKLESEGLKPVGDAQPLALLRRVYFDLTGLPPSAKEAQQFAADWEKALDAASRDQLYEEVVDRLLASPQFGERWGRYWLDVARYSESSGKDVNILYPLAWRYRDYVIDSFNEDVPYDHFVRQQIAGDLLTANSDQDRAANLVATGFLAIGPKSLNEMNRRQFAVDLADEQIDATTQAFLGMTVACARCHDHKFDPITQIDYTALAGIFLSTETRYGTTGGNGGRNAGEVIELPAEAATSTRPDLTPQEYQERVERLDDLRAEQRRYIQERQRNRNSGNSDNNANVVNAVRTANQISQLQAELKNYNSDGSAKSVAMGVQDKSATRPIARRTRGSGNRNRAGLAESIIDSPLFVRGEVDRPSDPVPRAVPNILPQTQADSIPSNASGRMQLADWMTDPENPLTSRVMVNRVWHWLFGAGLVTSVDNFGTTGSLPSHPELLDYLANEFIADGWSVKGLIRQIVLSRTYRLASSYDEANFNSDPANAWLWRHSPRRLDAEAIRDAMLFAAGSLELNRPSASLIGQAGDGVLGGPRGNRISEDSIVKATGNHRSVYMAVARNAEPEVLAVFDFPDAAGVQGARQVTNVPGQALFILNSDFVARHATSLANRVTPLEDKLNPTNKLNTGDLAERVNQMYWIALGRPASGDEVSAARRLLTKYRQEPAAGWAGVARAIFGSAEFRSID
jgi:hypothetical protein